MPSNKNILNELESLSPLLAGLPNKNIFSAPEGYFNTLSEVILAKAKNEPAIAAGAEIFKVPEGYFDKLPAALLNIVKTIPTDDASEEIKILSPLLYSLQSAKAFVTPPQYFSELPVNISKLLKQPDAKIIKNSTFSKIFKYAAAAVLIGAISLTVYKYTEKPFPPTATSILSASLTPAVEEGKNMNQQEFNEALHVLSNEDISTYLEKNGTEEDIFLLTSNLKEEDMPNKDAYILDKKTLDNYLATIELKN